MNTGLSERVIIGLVRPLRHAKSLLSAHIGMNPGISAKSKEFLRDRLACQPKWERPLIHVNRDDKNKIKKLLTKQLLVNLGRDTKEQQNKTNNENLKIHE